jgi:glucosylceramidase
MNSDLILKMKTQNFKSIVMGCLLLQFTIQANCQTKTAFAASTTPTLSWQLSPIEVKNSSIGSADIEINLDDPQQTFYGWGTCFNELGWDALNLLKTSEKAEIMSKLFSPKGDLRISIGRIPVGANDYARSWYSSDEFEGDFTMANFNITRDKQTLIPYIQQALSYNPNMTFWASPWSPPQWLKTNKHYANKSGGGNGLATANQVPLFQDQVIQDSMHLKAYALYFSKFIDAYKAEGVNITTLMYQNEAYSYAIYPSCSWSNAAAANFNAKYLGPQFAKTQPKVDLFLGTMNTNNVSVFDAILSDPGVAKYIKGVGFQWQGADVLPTVRRRYPNYRSVQSESECGSGTFDWAAASHTNDLIYNYLSNGCEKYSFWNAILKDNGTSTWGWLQNAFIRVNSSALTYTYTPEYYAVKHNTHFVPAGSIRLSTSVKTNDILAFLTPDNSIVVVMSNQDGQAKTMKLKVGSQYITVTMPAQSFNSYVITAPYTKLNMLIDEASAMTQTTQLINSISNAKTITVTSNEQTILQGIAQLESVISEAQGSQKVVAQLQILITKATALSATNASGKATLDAEITTANALMANTSATLAQLNTEITNLTNAMTQYQWSQTATATTPVDNSVLIQTPSFHTGTTHNSTNGSFAGWSYANTTVSGGDFRLNYLGGRNCWNSWSNNFSAMNLYQDLTGLAPGLYALSASGMCNTGELTDQHAYITSTLQTAVSAKMTIDNAYNTAAGWNFLTTGTVLVGADGKLRVGFSSTSPGKTTAGWFCATDFKLLYYGKAESQFLTLLNTKITEAQSVRTLSMLKGDLANLDSALVHATKATTITEISTELQNLSVAIDRAKLSNTTLTTYNNTTKVNATTYANSQLQNATSRSLLTDLIAYQQTILSADSITLSTLLRFDGILKSAQTYSSTDQSARGFMTSTGFDTVQANSFSTYLTNQNTELQQALNATEVAALNTELIEATKQFRLNQAASDSTDFSFIIKSADSGSTTGWVMPTGWSGINNSGDGNVKSGLHYSGNTSNCYFDSWNATAGVLCYTADQTLVNLPNGTYKFRCAARTDGTGAMIYGKTAQGILLSDITNYGYSGGAIWMNAKAGSSEKSVNNSTGYGWSWVVVDNIQVTDNKLTIGFSNEKFMTQKTWTGTWLSVDDFQLYYTKAATTGLNTPNENTSHPIIFTANNKIHVISSEPYSIYTTTGNQLPAKSTLSAGIYIVKVGQYTTKVLVP